MEVTYGDEELLKDALYDKSYTCPICEQNFTAKSIKVRKNQVVSTDSDLYSRYSLVNPLLYDILLCPHCGYAALIKSFDALLPKQKEWIRIQLSSNHMNHFSSEYVTLQEGIHKHKMALLICITKKGKIGEQAYIALRIAWLYREAGDKTNEFSFLERAYDGLEAALSSERFPIFGLDESTAMYILADVGYKLGKIAESKRYLASLITYPDIPSRIKNRALELKEKIINKS